MTAIKLTLLTITLSILSACGSSGSDDNSSGIDANMGGTPNVQSSLLEWPIDCVPGDGKCLARIGYPDINIDGVAYDCNLPGYVGHQGTDIVITEQAMLDGTAVLAASAGTVRWVFDGKFDQCPSGHPDCQVPSDDWFVPGQSNGTRVCTPEIECSNGSFGCFYCFDGGNVVVIEHPDNPDVHATRYDHLKTNSIVVSPGDIVSAGDKIAEAASAGRSTAPHLHFEVWDTGFYELADPWVGTCGPNTNKQFWKNDPPWASSQG